MTPASPNKPAASRRSRLGEKTEFYTRTQWLLGGGLVAFAMLFYFFTFRPTRLQAESLEQRLTTTQGELEVARDRASDLPRIAAENDALALRLRQAKRLARRDEVADFLRDITRLGTAYSLRNFTYQYGEPRRGAAFSQLPIVVEFEGDMLGVYQFLGNVEGLPRLTRLRSLAIHTMPTPALQNADGTPATRQGGYVAVQMALHTYFSNETATEAAAAGKVSP
jgi:Tfp pilus assembly protein PilO